jgi:hypothetical protein
MTTARYEHAAAIMTAEQSEEFARRLAADPTLQALAQRWDDLNGDCER